MSISNIKKIGKGFLLPSSAYTIQKNQIKYYKESDEDPEAGDLVYGEVIRIGQHTTLENRSGRLHKIYHGSKAIFVFGNRYAPDFYEGVVPDKIVEEADLLAGSGLLGKARTKSSFVSDPTRVHLLGYVCDEQGHKINTGSFPLLKPKRTEKKFPRTKMILICGTSMNSGKSTAAAACCWALSSKGYTVRGAKVTGTASLRDILHMNDAGANPVADFSYFGYPSTYLLPENKLIDIFNKLDLMYANNPKNFWVVEFADGIIQRETAYLLNHPDVRKRIHKLIFCANDAFGAIGGLHVLNEKFKLAPDIISGVCSSSPLHIQEIKEVTNIPLLKSNQVNTKELLEILTRSRTNDIKNRK